MAVGAQISTQSKFPTFDLVIHYLGHSLFPWSAFIPFAVGRLFRSGPPVVGEDGEAETRSSSIRLLALVGSAVAFGIYSLVAPKVGYLAFGAPSLLAIVAAISIRDFEDGAPASRALGVGVAVLSALYLRDYMMFPEKGLSVFAVNSTTFPESFKDRAANPDPRIERDLRRGRFLRVARRGSGGQKQRRVAGSTSQDYLGWPRSLARAWSGNLLFGLLALEAGLILTAAVLFVGLRFLHAKSMLQLGVQIRVALINGFWFLPLAPLRGGVGHHAPARLLSMGFRRTAAFSRGMATVAAGLVAGGLLSFVYYPALAAQLSPKEVFESYQRLHKAGEPLGLLGVGGKSATYYSGGDVKMLTDVQGAFTWLTSSTERRWLAVRNDDLGRLNSLFRARPGQKQNVPVLDARSSQILLVSNELLPNEGNQSPYKDFVLDQEPTIGNRVEANLEDKLLSLGWDVTDSPAPASMPWCPGANTTSASTTRSSRSIPGEWETFIHIDGFHRRFNGDHKTLGGKYPFNQWQVGDYIVDDYEFSLEPNFTAGTYNIYYGLFVGETRLKVKTGRHDDNRIDGGTLRVQ